MRDDCVRAVTEAAAKSGKVLSLADVRGIEGRIRQALRDNARENIDAHRAMTPAEQVSKAADRVARDIEMEKQRAAANVARQIVAHDRNQGFVDQMAGKGMRRTEAIQHVLFNFLTGKGGFRSLEQNLEGVVRLAKAKLEPIAAATQRYAGFWTDKGMVRDVVRELYGEDTGNPKAREVAGIWQDQIAEPMRKQFNELGGAIRKLSGWAVPQDHSMWKVAKAGLNDWVDFVIQRIDRSQYVKENGDLLSDAEMRAVLGDVWETISTDGAADLVNSAAQGAAIRNRGQNRRVLHFKNADSYLDYQAQFGERSLLETMNGHIENMGRGIAAMQTFGPNAEAALRALLDDAVRRDTKAGMDSKAANKARAKAELSFALASGKMGMMGDPRISHGFQIARSWLSAARLGSAVLSALTDSSNGVAVARSWNIPMPIAHWMGFETKAWADPSYRAMMRSQGVGVEMIAHQISRYGEEVFGHGIASNIANTVFRVSGLNFVDNVRRVAAGAMLFDRIGQLAREHVSLDAAHPGDVARLRDSGVSAKTWEVWRQAALESPDEMLTPAAIARLSNRSEQVKRDAMQHLIGVVSKDVDTVVPMPTLKARASIEYEMAGARGKLGGELYRSILQFKSFPIAMISNHWQRLQSMGTPGGKALYAAELIATSTILGAASIQLKSLVAGNNPQDMLDKKFIGRAFVQGGAAGLYGDILINSWASPIREELTGQLGPLVGALADAYKLGRTEIDSLEHPDKNVNVGGEAVRFMKGNTPGANLWWARAAFDHLIVQRLQDYYSPGYSERMQQRVQKYYNSGQWWKPSTAASPAEVLTSARGITAPRQPDLTTAVGGGR